jgi:hypothetical protein
MEAPGRGCPLGRCRQPGQVGEGRFQAKGLGIAQAQYPLGAAQDALGMRSLAGIISTGVRGSQKGEQFALDDIVTQPPGQREFERYRQPEALARHDER